MASVCRTEAINGDAEAEVGGVRIVTTDVREVGTTASGGGASCQPTSALN
jgi:hypothetical protein